MMDWAATKYQPGRVMRWNESRNTLEKDKGNRSDLGLKL